MPLRGKSHLLDRPYVPTFCFPQSTIGFSKMTLGVADRTDRESEKRGRNLSLNSTRRSTCNRDQTTHSHGA